MIYVTKATAGSRVLAVGLLLLALVASIGAPRAQQGGTGAAQGTSGTPQQPATPTAQKSLIPLAASTLAEDPNRYYGENVTLAATVDQSFSKFVFSVDQDKTKSTGKDVLVLTRILNGPVDTNTHVTVIGEVVRFDPADIARTAKDYPLDLAPEVIEKYRGRPAVLAASVISAAGVDLARRLPPPMTAEETAHANVMKQVAAANTALRKAIEGSDANLARENAAVLKQAFTKTAGFWKTKGKADATMWAQDALKFAESIDRAAADGKWDEAKTAAGTLGQACQRCHAEYRERFDDGSYRFKQGVK